MTYLRPAVGRVALVQPDDDAKRHPELVSGSKNINEMLNQVQHDKFKYMEDKKNLYIIAGIVGLVLLIGLSIGLFFVFQKSSNQPAVNTAVESPTNTNQGSYLPPTPGGLPTDGNGTTAEKLTKEKQFISSYFQEIKLEYQPKTPQYSLPIANAKEEIVNYRDFSRKIDIEPALEKLAQNGFVVLNSPFDPSPNDWQSAYETIKEQDLPIFISSDSILGLYQDTFQIIYKEIEKDSFYPSLWSLLKGMFDDVKKRYEVKKQKFGIETDLTAEANRLELAYLTVGLKLLQPEASQIKEVLGVEKKFFSPQEAGTYFIKVPEYLETEINQEISLIDKKSKSAKSAIFLYNQDYRLYKIPPEYQTSEKLKNYYLAITWLKENLFPIWSQADDCPDCLLDEQDQPIHFVAALYLTNDLASNQTFRNRWANIYKSISFFQGLETNLTYLDYNQILETMFDTDYSLDEIFTTDLETAKATIKKIQAKLNETKFPAILGGAKDTKPLAGLRLLRNYYLLENNVFERLAGQTLGTHFEQIKDTKDYPFTACQLNKEILRCYPTGLDIFNLLDIKLAGEILEQNEDSQYQNYQNQKAGLAEQIAKFDLNTWHDNSYLSLLFSLKNLKFGDLSDFPTFMQTEGWAKKTLNTGLAALVDAQQQLNFEKTTLRQTVGLKSYTGQYGYVEPQPELYAQLLANIRMVKDGFTSLGIIAKTDKTFDRLTNLEQIIEKILAISQRELTGQTLTIEDFDLINDFDNDIKSVTGDITKQDLQNTYSVDTVLAPSQIFTRYLDGFDYAIVVYPDAEGKMFLAIGPTLSYTEAKNRKRVIHQWQKDFELE